MAPHIEEWDSESAHETNFDLKFYSYFDTSHFRKSTSNFKLDLYYHKPNSPFYKLVELVLSLENGLIIKIVIDLTYVHYVHLEEHRDKQILSFKMLTPPTFFLSRGKSGRHEIYRIKSDWMQV